MAVFRQKSREVMQHGANRIALVHRSAVPDDDHRSPQMPKQAAEKIGRPILIHECLGVGSEVQAQASPPWRNGQRVMADTRSR